jgi:hypothetical protein
MTLTLPQTKRTEMVPKVIHPTSRHDLQRKKFIEISYT